MKVGRCDRWLDGKTVVGRKTREGNFETSSGIYENPCPKSLCALITVVLVRSLCILGYESVPTVLRDHHCSCKPRRPIRGQRSTRTGRTSRAGVLDKSVGMVLSLAKRYRCCIKLDFGPGPEPPLPIFLCPLRSIL